MKDVLSVCICIPAYNEAKNIDNILQALLIQQTRHIVINHIVVVSSASTDQTNSIVERVAQNHPNVTLIKQSKRLGKAAAINAFLQIFHDEIVVIESADTIPDKDCIEKLCLPFLENEHIGMTGGAPYPVNDPNTFLGYIIHAWWWFHRNIPRFGEIIAYRNVLPTIRPTTAVDEAYIQAKMIQLGYKIVPVDDAVVTNKGAETVSDLIKQRRRVMSGHARLYMHEKIKIDNMTKSSFRLLFIDFKLHTIKQFFWFFGGICIEVYARILGAYDFYIAKTNPFVWDIATSTKHLAIETIHAEKEDKS